MNQMTDETSKYTKIVGLPAKVAARFRLLAWLVFLTQVLIVATGGAVRLTGSGLGCSTWPKCTPESFVHNPEMGIHSYIEFGNRLLFFLLEIVAILAVIVIWRYRKKRKNLFVLVVIAALSVFIQAIIGGITVLSGLNPYVVGLHYVASALLVMLSALLVLRTYRGPAVWQPQFSISMRQWVGITAFAGIAVILLGILTTGSGPHAGDGGAARNELDTQTLVHLHALASYLTLFGTLMVNVLARVNKAFHVIRWSNATLLVMLLQIVVGVWQTRNALPPLLVGIHMVLATMLASGIFLIVIESYTRVLGKSELKRQ
ncbi:MAG TPA: COX15/CtaA family protein [Microbacteriaceae bacterium]|nr:COX15/CtaA family protein [Microbacteriaceae bacterium]